MSTHSKSNIEDLIRRLEAKQDQLITVIRGREIPNDEAQAQQIKTPSIWIKDRDLRLSVDELVVLLKEVRAQAK